MPRLKLDSRGRVATLRWVLDSRLVKQRCSEVIEVAELMSLTALYAHVSCFGTKRTLRALWTTLETLAGTLALIGPLNGPSIEHCSICIHDLLVVRKPHLKLSLRCYKCESVESKHEGKRLSIVDYCQFQVW